MTSSISPQPSPSELGFGAGRRTQRDTKNALDDGAKSFCSICDEIRTDGRLTAQANGKHVAASTQNAPLKVKKWDDATSPIATTDLSRLNSAAKDQPTLSCPAFGALGSFPQIAPAALGAGLASRQDLEGELETATTKNIASNGASPDVVFTIAGQQSRNDAKGGVANYIAVLSHAVKNTLKVEPESVGLSASVGVKTLKETNLTFQQKIGDPPCRGSDVPSPALMSTGIAQTITQNLEVTPNISSDVTTCERQSFVHDKAEKALLSNGAPQRQITISLEPEAIGPVKIRLTLNRAGISLQINVASSDALSSLRGSQESLRKAIESAGGRVGSLDMQLGSMLPSSPDKVRTEPSNINHQTNFLGLGQNSEAFAGHGGSADESRNGTLPQGEQPSDVEEHSSPPNKRHLDGFYL